MTLGGNTIQLSDSAQATTNYYKGATIQVGADSFKILSYAYDTKIATVNGNWTGTGDTYSITNILPNESTAYEITFNAGGGKYNMPGTNSSYSITYNSLFAVDLNDSETFQNPYTLGPRVNAPIDSDYMTGDSIGDYFDIAKNTDGTYSLAYKDSLDDTLKVYNFNTSADLFTSTSVINPQIKTTLVPTTVSAAGDYVFFRKYYDDPSAAFKAITIDSKLYYFNVADNIVNANDIKVFDQNSNVRTPSAADISAWYDEENNKYYVSYNSLIQDSFGNTDLAAIDLAFGATSNTLTLADNASAEADYYNGYNVSVFSVNSDYSTAAGYIENSIIDYDPVTKTVTLESDWPKITGDVLGFTGTAVGGDKNGTNTIILDSNAVSADGNYIGSKITVNGQIKTITAYNGSTKTATVNTNWTVSTLNKAYSISDFSGQYVKLDSNAVASDNYYDQWQLTVYDQPNQTGNSEVKIIYDYTANRQARVLQAENFTITPVSYEIELLPQPRLGSLSGNVIGLPSNNAYNGALQIANPSPTTPTEQYYRNWQISVYDNANNLLESQQIRAYDVNAGVVNIATYNFWQNPNTLTLGTKYSIDPVFDDAQPLIQGIVQNVTSAAGYTTITLDDNASSSLDNYYRGGNGSSSYIFIMDENHVVYRAELKLIAPNSTSSSRYSSATKELTVKTSELVPALAYDPAKTYQYTIAQRGTSPTWMYEIYGNRLVEFDPTTDSKTAVSSSPDTRNTYNFNSLGNNYMFQSSYSKTNSISDVFNMMNFKPYDYTTAGAVDTITDNDILTVMAGSALASGKVTLEKTIDSFNDTLNYVTDDYLTFNMIDDTNNKWEVISQKYGKLGEVGVGTSLSLKVNPVITTFSDSDVEIALGDTITNVNKKNDYYSFTEGNEFMKITIANDTYKYGDSFQLHIKDGSTQLAELDGNVQIDPDSFVAVDKYGGFFYKNNASANNEIYFSQSIIDFDSKTDSQSYVPSNQLWTGAAGAYYVRGASVSVTENTDGKTVVSFAATNTTTNTNSKIEQITFNQNFHDINEKVINASAYNASNSLFGASTSIASDSTYTNETISLVYAGSGEWEVYSNQSGQLTNGAATTVTMGAPVATFTGSGADGGVSKVNLSFNSIADVITNLNTNHGTTIAGGSTADQVFSKGDTIQMKLTKQAYATLSELDSSGAVISTGEKIKLVEGNTNYVVNSAGTGAMAINFTNDNFDYYDNIKSGSYQFTLESNSLSILTDENITLKSLDIPDGLTVDSMGIGTNDILLKTADEARAAYENAANMIKKKIKLLNGDIDLLDSIMSNNYNRLDTLMEGNNRINNDREANLRISQIKKSFADEFNYLKFVNIRAEIVDGLFEYLNN